MLVLPRNVKPIVVAAAKESARYSMMGVHVADTQDGNYQLTATDGRILAIVRGPSEDEEGSIEVAALGDAPDGANTFVVPTKDWLRGFGLAEKYLALAADNQTVTMAGVQGRTHGTPVEGRYPPVLDVFPKRKPLWSVHLNPKLLVRLLDTAAAFMDDESQRVTLHYYGPNVVVGFTTSNNKGQFYDGLIMPFSDK